MRDGVADRRGAALRDAEQNERRLWLRRRDDGFEILRGSVERQLADLAFAHAAAALVVTNEAVVLGEEPDPVLPDRALRLVLEVRQPVRRFDQGRPTSRVRPRDRRAVGGLRQVYRLAQCCTGPKRPGASLLAIGTNLTGCRGVYGLERDVYPMPRPRRETQHAWRIDTLSPNLKENAMLDIQSIAPTERYARAIAAS